MERIILENFQGHEHTVIEPAEVGITAICGKSDQGKSSVVRGAKWNHTNKPNGTAFIRLGSKAAKVTTDNVVHKRTKTVNSYEVDGTTFKALRGAVPEEVTEALNLGEENIQSQHDEVFLLNDSPGKVAQKLSTLVNLEPTTKALKLIASKKRYHKGEADAYRKSIEETELQLSKLTHINAADADLSKLESKRASIEQLKQKHVTLLAAVQNARTAQIKLSEIPSIDALEPAKQILKHYGELEQLNSEYAQLDTTMSEIVSVEHLISQNPDKLLKKAHRLKKLKDKVSNLFSTLVRAKKYKNHIDKYKSEEKELTHEKAKLLKGKCPLCGRDD